MVVDDNIFQDLYVAAEVLSSADAIRIYVVLATLLVLGLSIAIAFRVKRELEEIAGAVFVVSQRGRPPRKPKSIDDAIKKLEAARHGKWIRYTGHAVIFAICAFLIPTLTLYFGATFYEWFMPGQKPVLISTTGTIIDKPTSGQLWGFVFNQLSHGALNDYPEVFQRQYSDVTNNPDNTIFSWIVVFYRLLVGGFGLVFPYFFGRAAIVALRMPSAKAVIRRTA